MTLQCQCSQKIEASVLVSPFIKDPVRGILFPTGMTQHQYLFYWVLSWEQSEKDGFGTDMRVYLGAAAAGTVGEVWGPQSRSECHPLRKMYYRWVLFSPQRESLWFPLKCHFNFLLLAKNLKTVCCFFNS